MCIPDFVARGRRRLILPSYIELQTAFRSNISALLTCVSWSTLPSVHALCAGLKAYVTAEAADGAEDARKLSGGHGYMSISGLPDLIGATAGGCTFEGENHVMWQQLGRYLVKQVDAIQAGQEADEQTQYLSIKSDNSPCSATDRHFLERSVQFEIYRARAQRLVLKAHWHLRSARKPKSEAWNEHMQLLLSASRAHIEYLILQFFTSLLKSPPTPLSPTLHTALDGLCSLFALSTIINPRTTDALSFIVSNSWGEAYLNTSQLDNIRFLVNELLEQLLPEAARLTDAWDFSDASLCSALGMRDGNVYENVMRWVEQMPINKGGVEGCWRRWVDPILRAGVRERRLGCRKTAGAFLRPVFSFPKKNLGFLHYCPQRKEPREYYIRPGRFG
jgi:acyl-CoA oxidase